MEEFDTSHEGVQFHIGSNASTNSTDGNNSLGIASGGGGSGSGSGKQPRNKPKKQQELGNPKSSHHSNLMNSSSHNSGSHNNKMPRIPLKDIRRNYPFIFARAYNTCDREILSHCLYKYCVLDCQCIYKYIGITTSNYGADNIQIIGIEAILQFWDVFFTSVPDALFEIEENKLRVLANGCCASVSKFIFYGTKLFRLSVDSEHKAVLYKQPTSAPASSSSNPAAAGNQSPMMDEFGPLPIEGKIVQTSQISKSELNLAEQTLSKSLHDSSLISFKYDENPSELPPVHTEVDLSAPTTDFGLAETLQSPQAIILIGTFTLFINPEKRIYKFEFIHSMKQ